MKCLPLQNITHFKPGHLIRIDLSNFDNISEIKYYINLIKSPDISIF